MDFPTAFDNYRTSDAKVNYWSSAFLYAVANDDRGILLDCGCGVGRFTIPLSSFFRETIGIDKDPSMLEIAGKRCRNIKWLHADVNSIPLPNSCVDVVLASMLIEHLESLDSFLLELRRIVKQKGKVLLRTMLPIDVKTTTWYSFSKKALDIELSRTYSKEQLQNMFFIHGFTLIAKASMLNVQEILDGATLMPRLLSKCYEVLHHLNEDDFDKLIKNATVWSENKASKEVMSSSLLVFAKEKDV